MPEYVCAGCHKPIEGEPGINLDGTPIDVANTPHIARDWLTRASPYNRLCLDCRLRLHPPPEDRDEYYALSREGIEIIKDINREREEQDIRREMYE